MEKKYYDKDKNETLLLTKKVFTKLFNDVLAHFRMSHNINKKYNDSQLFGFGNYDAEKPNLKNDLELILKGYVNGKYLYNKYREVSSGKPIIKISREYKALYFNYLGFKDVIDFLDNRKLNKKQKQEQLKILSTENSAKNYYYICYYYGEDSKMTKGKAIIYNNWKTVEMIYIYLDENGEKSIYTFYGSILHSEEFAHFDTKFFTGSKRNEGAKFIFFIGKSSPNERHYLTGTYSGFDKYDRAIAGKMILKKYNSKLELDDEINDQTFDPIICQELNKHRIIVENSIRKNLLKFSKKSPFAHILSIVCGEYIFNFKSNQEQHQIKLSIEKYHYKIISLNNSVIIENDKIDILNKGQILYLDFTIYGIFYLQKVTIYLPTYFFDQQSSKPQGNFIGVDLNNNLVSGMVFLLRNK